MNEEGTTDGSDWADVPDGTMLSPEQSARRFLSLGRDEQVAVCRGAQMVREAASQCFIEDHGGAVRFAQGHTCPTDEYARGWDDALAEIQKRLAQQDAA